MPVDGNSSLGSDNKRLGLTDLVCRHPAADYHKHFTFHQDKGTGAQRMTFSSWMVSGRFAGCAVNALMCSLAQESQPALNRDSAPPRPLLIWKKSVSAFQLRRHTEGFLA